MNNLVKEITPIHQFHNKTPIFIIFKHVIQLNDIGVIDRWHQINFIKKWRLIFFSHSFLLNYFDCITFTCRTQFGLFDFRKWTFTNLLFYLIKFFDVSFANAFLCYHAVWGIYLFVFFLLNCAIHLFRIYYIKIKFRN